MVYVVLAIPFEQVKIISAGVVALQQLRRSGRVESLAKAFAVLDHLKAIGRCGGSLLRHKACDSRDLCQFVFNENNKLSAVLHSSSECKRHATGCESAIVAQVNPLPCILIDSVGVVRKATFCYAAHHPVTAGSPWSAVICRPSWVATSFASLTFHASPA